MSTNFQRLAPFIQEYIYQKRWSALRPVQEEAIRAILDSQNHVLITSGTASGKTEAAMLPILTLLATNPSSSIGVIYIGPLKALINDQFERLQELLEESEIPVQSWHGDIAQSKKIRFAKQAQGILQITPESLEAILINRHTELARLFGDLRFVVIDEVHAFIDNDRGRQVLCQLQRLARYQQAPARRIGLSATLNEMEVVKAWLAGGTDLPVELVAPAHEGRKLELSLECFQEPSQSVIADEAKDDSIAPHLAQLHQTFAATFNNARELQSSTPMHQHIYKLTQSVRKTLIFANSRNGAENVISHLRKLAVTDGTHDIYHVHHGNIATPRREAAEEAMRAPDSKACTAATLTLELGIDIGYLDQVLQIDSTHSVASFVQRLGRAGRRGGPARMGFYHQLSANEGKRSIGEMMPWKLLQTIAIIQLYLEEKWVEPPQLACTPFSLLYHQTMSTLLANTELTPAQLAMSVLTLSPFQRIAQEDYRILLRHLIETEHLTQMETNTLIIGIQGEKVVNNYRFYATFEDQPLFQVLNKSRELGTIHNAPLPGSTIGLAGYSWLVKEVQRDQRVIFVEPTRGEPKFHWNGGALLIHTRILQRMKEVLAEDNTYGYLQKHARIQLAWARQLAHETGLLTANVLPLSDRRYLVVPWVGTRTCTTQVMLLEHLGIAVKRDESPYYYEIALPQQELSSFLGNLSDLAIDTRLIVQKLKREELEINKYDRYIPTKLLQQAFITDYLDFEGAKEGFKQMILAP